MATEAGRRRLRYAFRSSGGTVFIIFRRFLMKMRACLRRLSILSSSVSMCDSTRQYNQSVVRLAAAHGAVNWPTIKISAGVPAENIIRSGIADAMG
jgi:hypothetical protein